VIYYRNKCRTSKQKNRKLRSGAGEAKVVLSSLPKKKLVIKALKRRLNVINFTRSEAKTRGIMNKHSFVHRCDEQTEAAAAEQKGPIKIPRH
jgi:hypothetical protein